VDISGSETFPMAYFDISGAESLVSDINFIIIKNILWFAYF
jgi:hypothetical protein